MQFGWSQDLADISAEIMTLLLAIELSGRATVNCMTCAMGFG